MLGKLERLRTTAISAGRRDQSWAQKENITSPWKGLPHSDTGSIGGVALGMEGGQP